MLGPGRSHVVRCLYVCYFGLREPLVQTQVVAYLQQLRDAGVDMTLLTFEPPDASANGWQSEWQDRLAKQGIRWLWLPYHKRPSLPATMYDIAAGARLICKLIERERFDLLHARAYIAAAMTTLAKRITGVPMLFDVRGLLAEEYVDAGIWKAGGLNYRLAKRAERAMFAAADGFVVLTERARELFFPGTTDTDRRGRPIEVIPCCVDLDRFAAAQKLPRDQVREELGLAGRRVITYVGALGGWYLTNELVDFLATAHAQDPTTFSLILTQSPISMIEPQLRAAGVRAQDCLIRKVPPPEIPRFLRATDLAVSFIKPCYSKLASSPTKQAEYLASGVPTVCNAGIGDVDGAIEGDRVGVILRSFHRDAYIEALEAVDRLRRDPDLADRCRSSARTRFDLRQVGGQRYRRLYQRLLPHIPIERTVDELGNRQRSVS